MGLLCSARLGLATTCPVSGSNEKTVDSAYERAVHGSFMWEGSNH